MKSSAHGRSWAGSAVRRESHFGAWARRVLRFAWHLTTVAWCGSAATFAALARAPLCVQGGALYRGGAWTWEEVGETGLLEVPIVGERLRDALVLHDHEARTVNQPPVLIRPASVQLEGAVEERL
jgi:hypothetical protein